MVVGLVGYKAGTHQIFREGRALQITYLDMLPNRVTQIKTQMKDGYDALQVTMGHRSVFRLTKPKAGHFASVGVEPGIGLWEFRLDQSEAKLEEGWKTSQELTVAQFASVRWVDVTAMTKGKGFSGVIKRHHFASQDASHGNSLSERTGGSIGQRQSPSRVFKGKKMAGQLGNQRRTLQSLQVIEVYSDHHLLVIKGSVPGAVGNTVIVRPAVRKCGLLSKGF